MKKRVICSMLICMMSFNVVSLAFGAGNDDDSRNLSVMDESASENVDFNSNSDIIDSGIDKVYTKDGTTTIENHVVLAASSTADAEAQIEELIKKEESNYSVECEDQEESSDNTSISAKRRPFYTNLTTGLLTKIKLSYYYTKKSNGYPKSVSGRSLTFNDIGGVEQSKEDIETHTYKMAFITTFHVKTTYYIFTGGSYIKLNSTSTHYKVVQSLAKKTVTWKKYKNSGWKTISTKTF